MAKKTNAALKAQQKVIADRIEFIRKLRNEYVRQDEKTALTVEEMHYTDASKYAQTYYGEVYRETTRHDTNWD